MVDLQLKNKVVLLTGANHGIGAATAKAFASQGAKVYITYYRDTCRYSKEELEKALEAGAGGDLLYRAMQQKSADPLVRDIRSQNGVALAHEADLGDANNIPQLFELCEAELGPVDILVNNHTYCVLETFDPALTTNEGSNIELTTAASIDAHFAVNSRACALIMSEYLIRILIENFAR